jgi:hypothetical protein
MPPKNAPSEGKKKSGGGSGRRKSSQQQQQQQQQQGGAKAQSEGGFVITLRSGSAEIGQKGQPSSSSSSQQQQRHRQRVADGGEAAGAEAEICKNYLAGRCATGDRCRRVHKPAGVPQTNLTNRDDTEIVTVSPTVTISRARTASKDDERKPKEICKNYLAGRCSQGDKCRRLHDPGGIPQNASAEKGRPEPQKQRDQKGKNKGDAKKGHDQPEQQAPEKGRGESQKQKDQKNKGKKAKEQPEQQRKAQDVSQEVCKNYLAGRCSQGDKCRRLHDPSGIPQNASAEKGRPEPQKQRDQKGKKKQEAQQQPAEDSGEDAERAARLKTMAAQAFERMEALKRQKSGEQTETPSQPLRTQSTQLVPSESPPDVAPSPPVARSSSEPEQRAPASSPKVASPTTNTPSGFNGKEELQKALASMEAWEVAELVASALTRAAGGPLPLVVGSSPSAARTETPKMEAAEYRRVISVMMIEDARIICAAEGVEAPEDAPVEELRRLLLDHFGCGDEDRVGVAGRPEEVLTESADSETIRVGSDEDEEETTPSAEAAARRRKLLMMEPSDGEFMLDPATQRVSSAEQA